MNEESAQNRAPAPEGSATHDAGRAWPEAEAELESEQESAAAMDADVPQPPDESQAEKE